MSEQAQLTNPYLLLYLFFTDEEGEPIAKSWAQRIAKDLNVPLHREEPVDKDSSQPICYLYEQPDACIVRIFIKMAGNHPLSAWQELSRTLFGSDSQVWHDLNQQIWEDDARIPSNVYWGASLFFGAEVATVEFDAKTWLKEIPLLPGCELSEPVPRSEQLWGKVWQLTGLFEAAPEFPHIYASLVMNEHAEYVQQYLFKTNNIDLVLLTLHKAYHHLRQYDFGRDELHTLTHKLDHVLTQLLEQALPKQDDLTALSKEYLNLANWSSQITDLQNTISINTSNYQQLIEELNLLRAKDGIFKTHLQQLKHGQAQLDADRVYYQAAIQRVGTGVQALRANLEFNSAQEWREFMKKNAEREKREADKEQKEAKKEKQRELLIARIGLILGLTQLWPILQQMMETVKWYASIRNKIDATFLIVIVWLTGKLVWELIEKYTDPTAISYTNLDRFVILLVTSLLCWLLFEVANNYFYLLMQ